MCRLVSIQTNTGTYIKVADIKAEIIKKILKIAPICSKIDHIYIFGSSVEERCTEKSDIDMAIVSNITRSKLYNDKDYKEITNRLYNIDLEQDYDILQFNSVDSIKKSKDAVCIDILTKGKLIYSRERV
ncbi:MAG: nucleotidyltransferase domain-containing protein [Agathobacter sp.]|nr:nucleotidyltransferase domain-containing protein [Agathobacter sp.]